MDERQFIGEVRGRKVFRGGPSADGVLFRGGVVQFQPYDDDVTEEEMARDALRILQEIEFGLARIEAQDIRIGPDAIVETVEMFDVSTGDYVVMWRVPCRGAEAVH